MGNYESSCMGMRMEEEEDTYQLVSSGRAGTVQILQKLLRAGQIMQKFPHRLVCHPESLYIGQKTPALSPNDIVEEGNKYFLLPEYFFQSELTIVLLASLISKSRCTPNGRRVSTSLRYIRRASALCQPFEVEKSDVGGSVRIRVSVEFMTKLVEEYGRPNVGERRHVVGGGWGPKLETIMENEIKKGIFQKLIFKTKRLSSCRFNWQIF